MNLYQNKSKMSFSNYTLLLCMVFCFCYCTPKISEQVQSQDVSISAPDPIIKIESKPIPVDQSVRIGLLPNGLKYYIKKNGKPEKKAELRLALNAGSILEDEDQQGLAHFVEHMAFNGTENFKKNELVDYLESVGTKFGADLNAYTSFDETVYMLEVRTDEADHLDNGLTVLRDWAGGISFDHEEIDKERGVVVSEWRTRLSPDQRMQQKYFPIMYHQSQYAKRLPIGQPEIIENCNYETVKRYYKDWYRPNLMAVAVVGDIDLDAMENEIKTRFGTLKNPDNERERVEFKVPMHQETLISINSDPEASFTQVRLIYKHDHISVETEEDYRKQLVRSLYNRMLNARLTELQQAENPPFTFSYSGYNGDVGDIDSYYCFAFCPEGGAKRGLETLLQENQRVLNHGFLESELERSKVEMLNNAEKGLKEADKTESRRLVMRYVYNYLDNNPIPSPEQTVGLYEKFLSGIKIEEVNDLTKKWIRDENRVVVITSPEKEETPQLTENEVRQVLENSKTSNPDAYVDNVSDEPLISKELQLVEIKSEEVLENIDATKLVLENGVEVYLKKTDFKNDEIRLSATSPGGQSLYPATDMPTVSFADDIISEAGLGNFDQTQLTKMMAGKTISISPYIGEYSEGVNGSCSPDDLEEFMQLLYLTFTAPRKDAKVLNSYISKEKSIYKNILSNPNYYFMDQVMKIGYGDNPRRRFPKVEDYDKIDLERAFEIYKERFADANDFKFIVVGNYDLATMKTALQKYVGNLPVQDDEESIKNLNINYVDGKIEKNLSKGKAPKTFVNMTFHGKMPYNKENNVKLKCLTEVLKIKMRESMREDKGGVYGVRVSSNSSKLPEEKYSITISFNTDPTKAEELLKTAFKDIENAKMISTDEETLNKVRETQKQDRIKNLKENRFWQNTISNALRNKADLKEIDLDYLEQALDGINGKDIQDAAKLYLDLDNYIKVVMTPEASEQ